MIGFHSNSDRGDYNQIRFSDNDLNKKWFPIRFGYPNVRFEGRSVIWTIRRQSCDFDSSGNLKATLIWFTPKCGLFKDATSRNSFNRVWRKAVSNYLNRRRSQYLLCGSLMIQLKLFHVLLKVTVPRDLTRRSTLSVSIVRGREKYSLRTLRHQNFVM